jgi:pyridoxamine 5'-phosphate oxidase
VFWCSKVKTQWRVRGHAYIIGPDIGSDAAAPVRAAIEKHMRGSAKDFSFTRELTAHFGNMSPVMRGSFRNPTPGTPLSEKPSEGEALGQKVEDLHDPIARKNFRVVIIVPEEVDRMDFSDPQKARRWNYLHVGDGTAGTWKITETWP